MIRDVVASTVNTLVRNEEVGYRADRRRCCPTPMLEVLHAGVDRLVVVCPKEHALARRRRISARRSRALAARAHRAGHERARGGRCRARETRDAPEIACEPTYMMTAVAMVRGGLGVTILPESAREVRAEPGLVVKAIDHPAFVRPIAI